MKTLSSLFMLTVLAIAILAFVLFEDREKNDSIKVTTGWTKEEFVAWAKEVKPIKAHKRWKVWKNRREKMEPNEPFLTAILNDANDIPLIYPRYQYEWEFELPKELPDPVIRVLKSVTFSDVNDVLGRNIKEVLPYIEQSIINICAFDGNKIVSFEEIEVKLSSLARNKLRFSIETECFILSDNPVSSKTTEVLALYVTKNCKVNVCYSRKEGKK